MSKDVVIVGSSAEDLKASEYAKLVEEGRKAANVQWTLGDLALKVETGYGEGRLQQYADEVGVEYESLRKYRDVSRAWPENVRNVSQKWSVHMVLASQPDRSQLIKPSAAKWTVAKAREFVKVRKEEADRKKAVAPAPKPQARVSAPKVQAERTITPPVPSAPKSEPTQPEPEWDEDSQRETDSILADPDTMAAIEEAKAELDAPKFDTAAFAEGTPTVGNELAAEAEKTLAENVKKLEEAAKTAKKKATHVAVVERKTAEIPQSLEGKFQLVGRIFDGISLQLTDETALKDINLKLKLSKMIGDAEKTLKDLRKLVLKSVPPADENASTAS